MAGQVCVAFAVIMVKIETWLSLMGLKTLCYVINTLVEYIVWCKNLL